MTGRTVDSSGAVVPDAKVTAIHKETNFTFNATTNSEGIYRIASLNPGLYRVTVEANGFKKLVQDNVEVRSSDTLGLDYTLQVGSVAESIEVQSAVAALDTETSATGATMTGSVLYDMPLYQRYVNSTLSLVPGMSSGGFAYGGSLGAYHLAGQRSGAIGIFEDGVNGNDQMGGTEAVKPLQNSVAEVRVISTLPPAEYGHSAGGVISVVKKSGTNEFHGMGSWYGRTRRMQHRLYFDRFRSSQPQIGFPNGTGNFFMQPDANFSGPIRIPKIYDGRNKTFFFFGFQRLHEKKSAQVFTAVPTDAMKQGDFNFPGVSNSNLIYDPATTRRLADGTWVRDPFPGNRVPVDRFDPVARKVLGFSPWVTPNYAGSFNSLGPVGNVLANEPSLVFNNDYNLRLDHQFSSAFKLYGSYTQNDTSGFGRPVQFTNPDFDHLQGNYTPFTGRNASTGYTWILSPSIVNDSRAGYYRRRNDTIVPSYGENWAQQLGIPNGDQAVMPALGVVGASRDSADSLYGITGATPGKAVNETFSFRTDTTWIRGSHAFKFGYEILKFRLNSANYARPAQYYFDGVTAGVQSNGALVPNTGNTFAGFLTGYVRQGVFTQEITSWLPRSDIQSFYFQDDWKITPRLTANIGVRYSNESPFNTKYGLMSNFDPTAVDDLTGRTGAIIHPSSGLSRRDNNNFNPRIGLAWHPLERVVLRGGVGMFTVDVKFPQQRGQYDEYIATANQQAAPGDPTPVYRISQGPNPVRFNVRSNGSSPFVGTNYGSRSVEFWDPALRNPYSMNWNAGVQYEFRRNYILDVSYQGSSGVGLLERWQYNTFPIDYAANDPVLRNAVFAAPQNYRPFTQFGDVRMRSNFGHSTYHSGTVKLEKRMSQGMFFSTFYTWSKAINSQDNDNDGTGVAPIQNRGLEKAVAGYNRPHRLVGTINYELPFGSGKRWAQSGLKRWILGGLEMSWIQTYESGNPLTFSFDGSPYNYYPTFAGNRRPNQIGEISIRDNWKDLGGDRFNVQNINSVYSGGNNGLDAFAYPAAFAVGTMGRNAITGLPLLWSTVSAQKNFRWKERYNAQIRWDFQNALKTYNFNPPTTTVDFRNPRTFGKVSSDPRTASFGGQPLMNLTLMVQF
ncbi:MAG: TonB-dependent receptor [Acidobacteria bacterium]|nr:TonB-dependent receptor [Acidobacteriota bacterium]